MSRKYGLFGVITIFLFFGMSHHPGMDSRAATASATGKPKSTPVASLSKTPQTTVTPSPTPYFTPTVTVRDDGLTLIQAPPSKEEATASVHYLSLVIGVGYGHDPVGKSGLTHMTNRLFCRVLQELPVLQVKSETRSNFSIFNIMITHRDFSDFSKRFQDTLRLESLTPETTFREILCTEENQTLSPQGVALRQFYRLLYGENHPFSSHLSPCYDQLTLTTVNEWFRRYYRPERFIVSSSYTLPVTWRPVIRTKTAPLGKLSLQLPAQLPEGLTTDFVLVRDRLVSVVMGFPAPALGEESHHAMVLTEYYLQTELKSILELDSSLCGRVEVGYSFYLEPSAPHCAISFQTLPENAAAAVAQVKEVLAQLAGVGIPLDQLAGIKEKVKLRLELPENGRVAFVSGYAVSHLFLSPWPGLNPAYLSSLQQVTPVRISKLMSEKITGLKIAAVGPKEAEEIFLP